MIRLFSKRHEKAIFERRLRPSISLRLRQRIWFMLQNHNYSFDYQPDPTDRWIVTTDFLSHMIHNILCERYGVEQLIAFGDGDEKVPVDLEGFVKRAYPGQVFDVIELCYYQLDKANKLEFQGQINDAFEEESSEWRLAEGQFFKVDSAFLEMHVIAPAYELLKVQGYEGALDELNEARNDLAAGDYKSCIHNSCKSFESVLKSILACDAGNASALIRQLPDIGFYSDLPPNMETAFGDTVFNALPFLRNRLSGHGQGEDVIDVPKHYAELALYLSASFINFAVKRSLCIPIESDTNEDLDIEQDEPLSELPFE